MFNKNCFFAISFFLVAFLIGCVSSFSVVKESPSSPKLSAYKSIWVGWLELREDDWKQYGYASKDLWLTEIRRHNVSGLQEYLKAELSGKTITGAKSKSDQFPETSDLYLKIKFKKLEAETGMSSIDKIFVDVDIIEGKTGKILYNASLMASSAAAFPRNWKAASFDGRLDNQMYNLGWGIAEKLK